MGILDKYKKQLEEDKKHEDDSFPEGSHLKEEDKEEYVKTLKKQSNSHKDMEKEYTEKMAELK